MFNEITPTKSVTEILGTPEARDLGSSEVVRADSGPN